MGKADDAITRLYACTTEEDALDILKRYPTRLLEKIVDLMLVGDYADTRKGCIAQIMGELRATTLRRVETIEVETCAGTVETIEVAVVDAWAEVEAIAEAEAVAAAESSDVDAPDVMTVDDAIANLTGAMFDVEYACRDDAEYGYLTSSRVHANDYLAPEGAEPYVVLSEIGMEEDRTGQVSTWQRSNYRRLRADFPDTFTDVSYVDGDALGAFVADLVKADGLVNILCGLKTDYPLYDESDLSELEWDETAAAWGQYLRSDAYAAMTEPVKAVWDGLTERDYGSEIERQFYAAMHDADYYPEHDSHEVRWDDAQVKALAETAIVNTLRANRRTAANIGLALYAEGKSWRVQGTLTGRDYSEYVRDYAAAVTFIRRALSAH